MNFRSDGGVGSAYRPPGGPLVPPHKILKVVSRISAYMFHQIVPPVRHPPSKIHNSCKTNRLMLYIGFSYTD